MDRKAIIEAVKEEVCKVIDNLRPHEIIQIKADATGSPENLIIQREQKIMLRTLLLSRKIDTSKIRSLE